MLKITVVDCSFVTIGERTTLSGVDLTALDGRSIVIDEDCMLCTDVRVWTTNHHKICDAATGAIIDPPADTTIGNHVWVGNNVDILKGTRIGDRSVIATGSPVCGEIPGGCVAAGYRRA